MADPWRTTSTLTILSGAQSSEELDLRGNGKKNPMIISIIAPATMPETVNPQLGSAPSGTFGILRSNGTAIALGAGFADIIGPIIAGSFRLRATVPVAADRVFVCFAEPFAGYV